MLLRILLIATIVILIHTAGERYSAAAAAAQPSGPRLVGTVEGAPFSGAVFDDGSGIQTFYRLHEVLPDGSKIIKIRKDHVEVRRQDGMVYELYATGDANAVAAAPAPPPANQSAPSPEKEAAPRPRGGKRGRQQAAED